MTLQDQYFHLAWARAADALAAEPKCKISAYQHIYIYMYIYVYIYIDINIYI